MTRIKSAQKKFWIPLLMCLVFLVLTIWLFGSPLAFITGAVSILGGILFVNFHWAGIFDWFSRDS